jgi:lipopolysaccharide export system permease protein
MAVTADEGTFMATDDPDTIILRLTRGRLVHDAPSYSAPRVLSFESHDLPIALPVIDAFRGRGKGTEELFMSELIAKSSNSKLPIVERDAYRANLHFRLVEVAMMLLVPLLAVALAVPPKRSTSGLGIFLSIVILVTYHKVNQYAQNMGAQGRIDPAIALWTPFLVLALLIVWMFWTLAFKPGGQPIGALERFASKIGRSLSRFWRFGRGRAQTA